MNCQEARPLLELLLDEALDSAETASLQEHLDSCAACREELRNLSATVELIRGIPHPAAPEGFAEEVLLRLPTRRKRAGLLLRLAPYAAAAALLFVTVILINRERPRFGEPGVTDVAIQTTPESLGRPGAKPRSLPALDDPAPSAETMKLRPLGEEEATGERGAGDGLVAGRRAGVPPQAPAPAVAVPGMREPVDPEAPGDCPPPAGTLPGAPPGSGSAAPQWEGADKADRGERVDRRYVLSGVVPDAVAGQIRAELLHLRRAGSRVSAEPVQSVAPEKESIEADADGEPNRMLVCVTEVELDLIAELVRQRPGARFKRTNGIHGEREEAKAPPGERPVDSPAPAAAPTGGDDSGSTRDAAAEAVQRVRVEILLRR